jgi:hypothetical protein
MGPEGDHRVLLAAVAARVFLLGPAHPPRAHAIGTTIGKNLLRRFSLSVDKCIQRTCREHEDLLSEFNSLLSGVEQTLAATGTEVHRMSDDEMFAELKRAMNPLLDDRG